MREPQGDIEPEPVARARVRERFAAVVVLVALLVAAMLAPRLLHGVPRDGAAAPAVRLEQASRSKALSAPAGATESMPSGRIHGFVRTIGPVQSAQVVVALQDMSSASGGPEGGRIEATIEGRRFLADRIPAGRPFRVVVVVDGQQFVAIWERALAPGESRVVGPLTIGTPATVIVHVIGPEGQDVQGASVILASREASAARVGDLGSLGLLEGALANRLDGNVLTATCDSTGRARVRVLPGTHFVWAEADAFGSCQSQRTILAPGSTTSVECRVGGAVERVAGVVTDNQGMPCVGRLKVSPVTLGDGGFVGRVRSVETGDDGRFLVDGLQSQRTYLFAFEDRATGRRVSQMVTVPVFGELRLALCPGFPLRGRVVVEGTGEPVGGCMLRFSCASQFGVEASDVTSATGEFVLEGIGTNGRGTIEARASGFAPHRVRVNLDQASRAGRHEHIEVRLGRGVALKGRVVCDDTGLSLPGALVVATTIGALQRGARANSAEDGTFLLERLPPETVILTASAPGYRSRQCGHRSRWLTTHGRIDSFDLRAIGSEAVEIRAYPAVTMVVMVADESGAPLSGARVWPVSNEPRDLEDLAVPALSSRAIDAADQESVTDGSGRAELVGLAAGQTFQVLATRPGYEEGKSESLKACEGGVVTVRLTAGGTITGVLVSAADGSPIANGLVSSFEAEKARRKGTPAAVSVMSGADGAFSIAAVKSGRVVLRATADGFARVDTVVDFRPSGALAVQRIPMPTGCQIRGRVRTEAGEPVPGAWVQAVGMGSPGESGDVGALRARTGRDGEFLFRGLRGEPYTLNVAVGSSARGGAAAVASLDGEPPISVIVSTTVGRGRVLDADGAPVRGFVVSIQELDSGSEVCAATTDADGRFATPPLGVAGVLVCGRWNEPRRILLNPRTVLGPALQQEIECRLTRSRSLNMRVCGNDGQGIAGAGISVSVRAANGRVSRSRSRTRTDGTAELVLPEGAEGTVSIDAPGWQARTIPIPSSAVPGDAEVMLEKGMTIVGSAPGSDVQGVLVSATGVEGQPTRTAILRPDRTFVIEGLSPGKYKVELHGVGVYGRVDEVEADSQGVVLLVALD